MTAPTLSAVRCLSSVYACRLRVTQLHDDGTLDPGTANQYISDALISIGTTPQIEAGQEITQRNGCGEICVEAIGNDEIKRYDLALSLCQLDSELIYLMTGGTLLTKGGVTVGLAGRKIGDSHPKVCVEAWSQARTRSDQAVVATGDGVLYHHFVWPKVEWTLGAFSVENNALIVPLTGRANENANMGIGPASDWPAVITSAQGWYLDDKMPAAACGLAAFNVAGSAS
jgi:hypothetical protein